MVGNTCSSRMEASRTSPTAYRKPEVQDTQGDQYSRLYSEKMVAMMEELLLPRYGLTKYLNEAKAEEASRAEKQLIENLSKAGQRIMGFSKSTFFKRMDSSGFAFLLTLKRHILRNAIFLYAIDNKLNLPIGDENSLPMIRGR